LGRSVVRCSIPSLSLAAGVRPMTQEYAVHGAIVETGWLLAAAA
jgi:hypothetical protein